MIASAPSASAMARRAGTRASRAAPRSIRFWLVLLVLASVVPAALIAAFLIHLDYRHGQARLERDAIATARALAAAIDRELAGSRSALIALASSPYLGTNELAAFHQQAGELLRDINVNNFVLIDAGRRQRVNTLRPFGAELPIERNAALLAIFDTGQPAVTDLFVGPVAHRPLMAIGVPVRRADAVVYVLAAGLWTDRLSRALAAQPLPERWVAIVHDSAGQVVARSPPAHAPPPDAPASPPAQRAAAAHDGWLDDTRAADGRTMRSYYVRSDISDWTVVLGVPRTGLSAELQRSLLRLGLGAGLMLVVSIASAWVIGGRIARSTRALCSPALALGRGEAVSVERLPLKELDEVAGALTSTSELLQRALHDAHHDALTGLVNRTMFEHFLRQRLVELRRNGGELALLYIDLDGFKAINDRHGHHVGDELLREVARRLLATVRLSDVPARLGGDEFAVMLPGTGAPGAVTVAEHVVEQLGLPYALEAGLQAVSASVGIAAYPQDAGSAEQLMHRADEAMYRAKAQGRRRYVAASSAS